MRKNSTGALFLMELIIAIFFFSLASTVCIQLFVKAHLMSRDSVDLNKAVMWSQNFAEAFDGFDGNLDDISNALNCSMNGSDTLLLEFDKNWNQIDSSATTDPSYSVSLENTISGDLHRGHIVCIDIKNCKTIYELDIELFIREAIEK